MFVGQITPINARLRLNGVLDELAGQKDAKGPVSSANTPLYRNEAITDEGQRASVLDNAKDALDKLNGTENLCMVGLWAYNAGHPGGGQVEELAGKVKIVSFDEDPATLSAIEAGEIYATVVQDPYNFGYKSVEVLAEAAKSGDKASLSKEPVRNIMYRVVAREASKDPVTGADRLAVGPFRTS